MTPTSITSIAGALALALGVSGGAANASSGTRVVELTQTGCQFLEPERATDHGYQPSGKPDCERINDRTAERRLAEAAIITLEPGRYVFRVTNKNVPYALGFWLRGEGLYGRATLPSVSGGGLGTGETRDYAVTLEPGEYLYSCPLNATPDYKLVVKG